MKYTQHCCAQHLECRQRQVAGLAKRRCVSQHKVANTSSERDNKGVGVQAGCRTGELWGGGRGCAASGLAGGVVGAVGAGDGRCGVAGCVDGAGLVCNGAGRRAGHGDSVGAIESRGDVDSCVIGIILLGSEDARNEREEKDNDVLEGAHGDWCC